MRQSMGLDLAEITSELEGQLKSNRDYLIRTTDTTLHCEPITGTPMFTFKTDDGNKTMELNANAQAQLCSHLSFPYSQFLRVLDHKKGTERERKALTQFLAVQLQEHSAKLRVLTKQGFWEDRKVVALLPQSHVAASGFTILSAILALTIEIKGLHYRYGNISDNYLTIQMMGTPDKDGMSCGLQFDWSDTGSPSFVRPVFETEDELIIVPSNHWMEIANVTLETAKQCVTGARAAVKRYQTQGFGLIPSAIDIKALLEETLHWVDKDAIRKIYAHFVKAETRTVQALARAVAKYAQTALKLSYDERVEFQCEAGKMLDINNDTLAQYFDAGLATTKETKKDGTETKTKRSTQRDETPSSNGKGGPAKSDARQQTENGSNDGSTAKGSGAEAKSARGNGNGADTSVPQTVSKAP